MRRLLAFLPLLSLIAWVGCSSDPDGVDVDTSGNQPNSPGEDLLIGDDGRTGNAPGDERTCLGETHQAEARGLDIFVMLDISDSMNERLPRTSVYSLPQTKWDAVKQSLESFVQAPESADIGMGLQYFPQLREGVPDTCTSNADCGEGGPCSTSVCVTGFVSNDPRNPLAFIGETDPDCQGAACICSSDTDCSGNAVCRGMLGYCIVLGQGTVADLPATPRCNSNADCAGLPGTGCDVAGVCDRTLGQNPPTFCLSTLGCPAGAGSCAALPDSCLNQTRCEADVYGTPAVPISSDATRSSAIIESLEAVQLNGLTPTGPALQGALDHARAWALEHPERQVVTVFATDGLPTECTPQGGTEIALLAADANAGAEPVRTFVIGVFGAADLGDGRTLLDALARSGGSERAFVINTGDDVGAEFLQALNQIRDTAVSCEFQLDSNTALDFDKVNLRISDPAGSLEALANVGDVSACGGDQGWYYVRNDNGTPTQIQVCPSTCTRLTTTSGISAELEVGCATRIR
jgi:hypothetical protein